MLLQKERLRPLNKARREANQNKLVEESKVADRVDSYEKVSSGKDHLRAWHGFVKPKENGLRKINSLI